MNSKIEKLARCFAKLPRVGGRAGMRYALHLLQDKTGKARALAELLSRTAEEIRPCSVCGCLSDADLCEFCRDNVRENGQLCIVRDMGDVWVFEKSGAFQGRYHIIGGLLSGANGIGPEELNIYNLSIRIANEKITEVIFALPNTVEGKTTLHYVQSRVQSLPPKDSSECRVQFSELACGIPMGGDLDYLDDGTLTIALGGRKKI
jgi:recombination protein RecR